MKLDLQKLKVEKERESKLAAEKHGATMEVMQRQLGQAVDEIEQLKAGHKKAKDELLATSERQKLLQAIIEETLQTKKKLEDELVSSLRNPNEVIKAARSMSLSELQMTHYQIGLLLQNSYAIPQSAAPYPLLPPHLYPYYPMPSSPTAGYPLPYHLQEDNED